MSGSYLDPVSNEKKTVTQNLKAFDEEITPLNNKPLSSSLPGYSPADGAQ